MSAIDMQSDKSSGDERAPDQTGQAVHMKVDDDGIALLRLGTPDEKLVTFTESRIHSLQDALHQLSGNPAISGVIVTGPGTEMFAAGADIGAIEQVTDPGQGEEKAALGRRIFGQFQELSVPVVAAIEGPCLGGGMELALFCDFRVVSDHKSTQLGLPEVKLGIVPGFRGV